MISADEQAVLLSNLLDGKLPFSQRNILILKDIMQISKTARGALYGKTGSGTQSNGKGDLGWFVGFLESKGITYVFVCNITGGENPSGKIARAIVENVLRFKGLL
jgi:beta-lactamase class D